MRFKFCGDLDCPDWVLAHISLLSKLSSVKLKLVSNEVVNDIILDKLAYDKIAKLSTDAKFDGNDIKASVAGLSFIFISSSKYNIDSETLSNELQQLGLPKEHAMSLSRVYSDKLHLLRDALRKKSLRVNRLNSITQTIEREIRSDSMQIKYPVAVLELNIASNESNLVEKFSVPNDKLSILLNELKQIESLMADYSS